MKRILIFLLVIVMGITCMTSCNKTPAENTAEPTAEPTATAEPQPTVDPSKVAHVILLLGQSNAVGTSFIQYIQQAAGSKDSKRLSQGIDSVRIIFYAGAGGTDGKEDKQTNINKNSAGKTPDQLFKKVKQGQAFRSDLCGPETGMALYLADNFPDTTYYIIKAAKGAVSINGSWLEGKYCWNKMDELWKLAKDSFESAGLVPQIDAICWMQGEEEGSSEAESKNYLRYQTDFAARLREYFKDYAPPQGIRFVDAGISDYWKYHDNINNAKREFAKLSENNVYFDTMEAGLEYNKQPVGNVDLCHFDAESVLKLGKLFAEYATK